MRSIPWIPIVILVVVLGAMGIWYFSAHEQAKRQLSAVLEDISEKTKAADQNGLLAAISQLLTDDARVEFSISYNVFGYGSGGGRLMEEQFNRQQFADYIRGMTSRMEVYQMEFTIEELNLSENNDTANAVIGASGFATGPSMLMGRNIATRYVVNAKCSTGEIVLDKLKVPHLKCDIRLNQQPDLQDENLHKSIQDMRNLRP